LVVARLVRDPIRAQRARGGAAAEPEGANTAAPSASNGPDRPLLPPNVPS
jgi:hypothetical protein